MKHSKEQENGSKAELGAAMVELAVVISLITVSLGLFWGVYTKKELEQTITMSALAVLSDPDYTGVKPYTTDSGGSTVAYSTNNTNVAQLLTRIGEVLINRISSSTKLSTSSNSLVCRIEMGYLTINPSNGLVSGSNSPAGSPQVLPVGSTASLQLTNLVSTYTSDYTGQITGQFLQGPNAVVKYFPGAPSASLYFGWSMFYTWGCEASVGGGVLSALKARVGGIVVPRR